MPVFKRSIRASRSTQNYQFRLRTFGATFKSVKRDFSKKTIKCSSFFNKNSLHVCRFGKRKTLIWGKIIRENTLHSFGRSSKSSQQKLIILSATWSCDVPLGNWLNEVIYLMSRFLVRPMRHRVSFFVFSKGQKRIHDQKSSRKSRFLETYHTKLIWFGFHY